MDKYTCEIQIHPMFLFIAITPALLPLLIRIQIHPMFLFIVFQKKMDIILLPIQIHPMFLFIMKQSQIDLINMLFKYILCSYSSSWMVGAGQSVLYSNTSYVLIHRSYPMLAVVVIYHSNTSYVLIHQHRGAWEPG